jgi:hypothetical protein
MPASAPALASSSVAPQQKALTELTNNQLHLATKKARNEFFNKCVGAETFAQNELLPLCEEIIARFKQPGVKASARPDGKPTVEAYFKSIDLNYSTVRSWIRRERLKREMFTPKSPDRKRNKFGKDSHLTPLEAKLLGTANLGHDLVKAIKANGNVEDAIRQFEDNAPTPERIEEYIERPVTALTSDLGKLPTDDLFLSKDGKVTLL